MVITPVFIDQWDNAYCVNQWGSGLGLNQLQKITAEAIGDAMIQCVSDPNTIAKAKYVGETMRREKGVERFVEHIEQFWTQWVETGKYKKHIDERKATNCVRNKQTQCCCCVGTS